MATRAKTSRPPAKKTRTSKPKPKTIYYARPIWMNGSRADQENVLALMRKYPGAQIDFASLKECGTVSPNNPRSFLRDVKGEPRRPKDMQSFMERAEAADLVVIAESGPNSVSSGVFAEAQHALHNKVPVKVIREDGSLTRVKKLEMAEKGKRDHTLRWGTIKT